MQYLNLILGAFGINLWRFFGINGDMKRHAIPIHNDTSSNTTFLLDSNDHTSKKFSPMHYRKAKYRNMFLQDGESKTDSQDTSNQQIHQMKESKKHDVVSKQTAAIDEESDPTIIVQSRLHADQLSEKDEKNYATYITERKKQVESYANEDNRDKRSQIPANIDYKKQTKDQIHKDNQVNSSHTDLIYQPISKHENISKRHNLDVPDAKISSVQLFNYYLKHPESMGGEKKKNSERTRGK